MYIYINKTGVALASMFLLILLSIIVPAQLRGGTKSTGYPDPPNKYPGIPNNYNMLFQPGVTDMDSNLYSMCLPFEETWSGPNGFNFYAWTFTPSQGNWVIGYVTGYPPPSANFQGASASIPENYSHALVSLPLHAENYTCADVLLSFDIQLVDRLMTGTEKMTIEVLYDETWHYVTEYTNNDSFGWKNDIFLLSGAGGHQIKIRFIAHGINKYNFQEWLIDNILVEGVCPPPVNLQGSVSSGCVTINWNSPCPQQKTTYNVYRSNHYGNPPYVNVANDIEDTVFSQTPPWGPSYTYKYYVVALQVDTLLNMEFCASESSDTVQISFPVGIEFSARDKVSIYPVPASEYIVISGDLIITSLCLTDQLGKVHYEETGINLKRISINIPGWSPGVYYARINTSGTSKVMKFIIQK